jgi:hypothetical protein
MCANGPAIWGGCVPEYSGVQVVSEPENCQGILDFNCGQMRVPGCKNYCKFVLSAGVKAKSVTTVSAEALAKAEQLTHIVRVSLRFLFFEFVRSCPFISRFVQ